MIIKRTAAPLVLACSLVVASSAFATPTVFPTGVTINEPGVAEGYAFVPNGPELHLLEPDGTIVHTWYPPCGWTYLTRPLENGHILVKSCPEVGSYAVMELDWDSNVVFSFSQPPDGYPEDTNFHHDWLRLDNGNYLILTRNVTTWPAVSSRTIVDDFLLEVNPAGDVVWEWHTADHIDEFGFSQERRDLIYEWGGDWSHANAVAPIPADTAHTDPRFMPGNLIVSYRYQGIAVIDRASDQIVYFDDTSTVGQHDAYMIPGDRPGGGNILSFDNGWAGKWGAGRNREYSRVVEVDPVSGTLPYIYDAEASGLPKFQFFASFVSGAQRQPNGNTLICEGDIGRVFEITPTGQIVWEYIHPYTNPRDNNSRTLYRAYKVPLDWAGSYFTPDLVVSGTTGPGPVPGGGELNYTIQVDNTGTDPAVDVRLDQETPTGTTFRSITSPPGWGCTTPAVGGTGPINCAQSSASSGSTSLFQMTLDVDPCMDGTFIDNWVTVTSMGNDVTPADNSRLIRTLVGETDCADVDPCTVDRCDEITRQCVHDPLVCVPIDSCHSAGVCDSGTGLCSSPVLPDDTECDDGDATTCADVCLGGTCAGTFVPAPDEVSQTVQVDHDGSAATISWSDAPGEFNVYEGAIVSGQPFDYNHVCMNPGAPLTAMTIKDPVDPAPGQADYYLVTRVGTCRDSISGNDSTGSPRIDPYPCPYPEELP